MNSVKTNHAVVFLPDHTATCSTIG